jgi:hypothetical protein
MDGAFKFIFGYIFYQFASIEMVFGIRPHFGSPNNKEEGHNGGED